MKKYIRLSLFILLIGCLSILIFYKDDKDLNTNNISEISTLYNYSKIPKDYYEYKDGIVHFTSADTYNLIEKFENSDVNEVIKDLTSNMKIDRVLKDGGTTIYKNNKLTIIKCKTLDGNKDIYIGNNKLKYQDDFCK